MEGEIMSKIFNLDIAIEDKGNCERQEVDCNECFIGKTIKIDDQLCPHEKVYQIAQVMDCYRKKARSESWKI